MCAQIDKEGANIERVKQELSEAGVVPEEWGGQTPMVPVSIPALTCYHNKAWGSRNVVVVGFASMTGPLIKTSSSDRQWWHVCQGKSSPQKQTCKYPNSHHTYPCSFSSGPLKLPQVVHKYDWHHAE